MVNNLNDFIATHRERFENRHNNMFSFSFAEISRCYEYLRIIQKRYTGESKEYLELTKAQEALVKPGSHTVSDEMMVLFQMSSVVGTRLHLDIESFYLFAKILLDKVALALEFYFGQSRGLPFESHDNLVKNIEEFAKAKSLTLPNGIVDVARKLKQDISDFRDYQIAHIPSNKNARITRGTMWDSDGNTKLLLSSIYPTEKDKQVETRHLHELICDIDTYIDLIVTLASQNRDKTKLNLDPAKK